MFFSCFVVIVVLCIFIFVYSSVELLPSGESPIAVIIIVIIIIIIIICNNESRALHVLSPNFTESAPLQETQFTLR